MASFLLLFSTTEAMASSILVRQGSRGPAVRQVQSLLIEQGWLTGAADGICGNQTVAAIKSFQKANGLDADGVCGNGTYSVLSGGREYEPSSDESEGTVMYVNATAYSADDPGNSAYTALGTHVRHGIIAVDPDIIPLGTHVYIPGYGDAVAEDVGLQSAVAQQRPQEVDPRAGHQQHDDHDREARGGAVTDQGPRFGDRKSTRLNSSHT